MITPVTSTDLSIDDRVAPTQVRSARALVQAVRWRTGLSRDEFARAFHISGALLADLELGRARADDALSAYLRVIDYAPEAVRDALDRPRM